MNTLYVLVAAVLLASLGSGLYRAVSGPTPGDRVLVIQLFGTAAVAMLLLLGEATSKPALVDVALVLALTAAITVVAFVRHTWTPEDIDEPFD